MYSNYAILDKYLNVLSGSPSFFKFFGSAAHNSLYTLFDEHTEAIIKKNVEEILAGGSARQLAVKMADKSGEIKYCFVILAPDGEETLSIEIWELNSTLEEIKRLKRRSFILQGAASAESKYYFGYVFESAEVHIFSCVDGSAIDLFVGTMREVEAVLREKELIDEVNGNSFEGLIKAVSSGSEKLNYTLRLDLLRNGHFADYSLVGSTVYINGKKDMIAGTFESAEVTNRIVSMGKDSMTGTLSKEAVAEYAKTKLRIRASQNIAVAICDLDNFKAINDNMGHAMGDKAIIRFADIIGSAIHSAGVVGRFGGDEFIIVLDDIRSIDELREYFRSIRTNTENTFARLLPGLNVTCSIGIAELNELEAGDEPTYETLFQKADLCLYLAKEYGKNRYVYYGEMAKKAILEGEISAQSSRTREMVENDFTLGLTDELFEHRLDAIPSVIEAMGKRFELSNINIFYGRELELKYHWGSGDVSKISAEYLREPSYLNMFNSSGILKLAAVQSLEMSIPAAFACIKAQGIRSLVQYLIKHNDKPCGLISFEMTDKGGRYWHKNEVSNFALISQLISQLITSFYEENSQNGFDESPPCG